MHIGLHLPRRDVTSRRPLAVLTSGGVDSAVLTADLARQGSVVQPLYIRLGLTWEATEETYLRRFLDTLPANLTRLSSSTCSRTRSITLGADASISAPSLERPDLCAVVGIAIAMPRTRPAKT